ncbi:MAG: HD-GYP domain-containing protein [Halopseudomonas sp.]|uniref:HD-GYP domain-containing protein n=1 Tax=Halopseudomonas sp. TaxID=2901191 RepID=UPI00300288BB
MLKKIPTGQVRIGMYVERFCGSWMQHPFWSRKLLVEDMQTLLRIQESSVEELIIDLSKGVDVSAPPSDPEVPPAPAFSEADVQNPEPALKPPAVALQRCSMADEVLRAQQIFRRGKQAVKDMFADVRLGQVVNAERLGELVGEMNESLSRNPHALISVARIKHKDEYTYLHSVAVAALMVGMARASGLSEPQVLEAGMAGLLHDLGKAAMPEAILNKPGKLTTAEFAVMQQHPVEGHRILLEWESASPAVLDVCLHHHEKVDGSGYPQQLVGEHISLLARMGAICDVYDAVTSNRPYKAGWGPAESLSRMASWHGHFDSELFQRFVRMLGIYPVGSLVRLASDRLGVVVEQGEGSLLTPRVRVFYSIRLGRAVPVQLVDLADAQEVERITGRENPDDWPFNNLDALWLPT